MKKEKLPIPKEEEEEVVLSDYLNIKGIKHTHVVNETSIKNFGLLNKWKRMGKSAGFPDHVCIVQRGNKKVLVFIEMKRVKQSSPLSTEQAAWLLALGECTEVKACMVKGADQAISIIESIK